MKKPNKKLTYSHREDTKNECWKIAEEEDFSCNDVTLYSSEGEDMTVELEDFNKYFKVKKDK